MQSETQENNVAGTSVFSGTVLSGRGEARRHMEDEYAAFRAATGEDLIPGSLNLILSEPVLLNPETALVISEGRRMLWRAELSGQPVWIYRFQIAPLHAVEVLASVRLRDILGLKDGDAPALCVSHEDIGALSFRRRLAWRLLWQGRRSWSYRKDWYFSRTSWLAVNMGVTQSPARKGIIRSLIGFVYRGFR